VKRRDFITLFGGAVVAWPRGVLAEVSARRPLVALLGGQSSASASHSVAGFTERIQELGYVAGRDIDIVYRYANGDMTRVPALWMSWSGLSLTSWSLLTLRWRSR
jgi:putative tryptophan/tyrosine transport system substrate-binding protein